MLDFKPKLVCVGETFLNESESRHHMPLFTRYFDISNYDDSLSYDHRTTFMYRYDKSRAKVKKYKDYCKFIADSVWEPFFFCSTDFDENTIGLLNRAGKNNNPRILTVPKWLWFEEHFSQQKNKDLIKHMPFTQPKTYSFLLQMAVARPHRVWLYEALKKEKLLSNALYSFLEYDIALDNVLDNNYRPHFNFADREYRPEWYNHTYFTVVAENMLECPTEPVYNEMIDRNGAAFVTEKTMKPIMYGHPFVILGDVGIYDTLESWGFQTFPELFDQSCNQETDVDKRIDIIVNSIKAYQHKDVNDKVMHNYERFWDTDLVERLMVEEMINPMIKFIMSD